jgi:hypothetical protein
MKKVYKIKKDNLVIGGGKKFLEIDDNIKKISHISPNVKV